MMPQVSPQHDFLKDDELIANIKKTIYLLDRIQELPTLMKSESMNHLREPAMKFIEAASQIEQIFKLEAPHLDTNQLRSDSSKPQLPESVISILRADDFGIWDNRKGRGKGSSLLVRDLGTQPSYFTESPN